jgi:UDP-N-acetylmuramate--alanine ligase
MLGQGRYLIAEADESDGSFLCLLPRISIVTNVDADHLDFYKDLDEIRDSFVAFMNSVPFYGLNVVCGDDPGVQSVLPRVRRPVLTYGFGEGNELRAEIITCEQGSRFHVYRQGEFWGEVSLTHPGRHNVLNALAAIGVAMEAGVPKKDIIHGLGAFGGVGRRFEHKGERDGVLVVDDYGHHPTEIAATLETARLCYPDKRWWWPFSRTGSQGRRPFSGNFPRSSPGWICSSDGNLPGQRVAHSRSQRTGLGPGHPAGDQHSGALLRGFRVHAVGPGRDSAAG